MEFRLEKTTPLLDLGDSMFEARRSMAKIEQ